MGLRLITGPANAGKAQMLLAELRRGAAAGLTPWLVVPTAADALAYRTELAAGGALLGVRVLRFSGLIAEVLASVPGAAEQIGQPAAERILAAALHEAGALIAHGRPDSGTTETVGPGMLHSIAQAIAELHGAHVDPELLNGALAKRSGSGAGSAHTRKLRGLARALALQRELLDSAGVAGSELLCARALECLREQPKLWQHERPLYFYGFDDLTDQQLDVIETLAGLDAAEVTVSLAFEPQRSAFAARGRTFELLAPHAAEHVSLPASAEHYSPAGRIQLAHLERRLFEAPEADAALPGAGGAIGLLQAADQRLELEALAQKARNLLEAGMPVQHLALVHRRPQQIAELAAEVFAARGIALAFQQRRAFAQTATGAALTALARCALVDCEAAVLLRYLRSPGLIEQSRLLDHFERRLRIEGIDDAGAALVLWEQEHWPIDALKRLRSAAAGAPRELPKALAGELWRIFCKPREASSAGLAEGDRIEAAALSAAIQALEQIAAVAARLEGSAGSQGQRAAARIAAPAGLLALLEGPALTAGVEEFTAGAGYIEAPVLHLSDPLALRARRVRVLMLCGMQEGTFPIQQRRPGFLDGGERRLIAELAGIAAPAEEDVLGSERYLLYACLSRAEEQVLISWHDAEEGGKVASRSLFVDDICELYAGGIEPERILQLDAAYEFEFPPGREQQPWAEISLVQQSVVAVARDDCAPAPGRAEPQTGAMQLQCPPIWSPSAIEACARCPARWVIERILNPEELAGDSPAMREGTVAHAVMHDLMRQLGGRLRTSAKDSGAAMLLRAEALQLLAELIAEHGAAVLLGGSEAESQLSKERLHADLALLVEREIQTPRHYYPTHFEISFGFEREPGALPVLDLGAGVLVRGRIDRIDVDDAAGALVYDYKRTVNADKGATKWPLLPQVQAALYMKVAEQHLGLEIRGGLYLPYRGSDRRARGLVMKHESAPAESVRTDLVDPERFAELWEQTLAVARSAALSVAAGDLAPRPHSCGGAGSNKSGCAYPEICRCLG